MGDARDSLSVSSSSVAVFADQPLIGPSRVLKPHIHVRLDLIFDAVLLASSRLQQKSLFLSDFDSDKCVFTQ